MVMIALAAILWGSIEDVAFTAQIDGTAQRYVMVLPEDFDAQQACEVCVALHGHGSDRWQFARDSRDECRAVRDVAMDRGMVLVCPDYRAKTSWMGPKAEADVLQILEDLKRRYRVRRTYVVGGSMGGSSALTFTALHPDLVAGVVCLNGTGNHLEYDQFQEAISESFGGTKTEKPDEYKRRSAEYWPERFTMPVAITAGGQDTVVPPASSLRLAEVLIKLGRPVKVILREAGGHATNYEDTKAAFEFVLSRD